MFFLHFPYIIYIINPICYKVGKIYPASELN